MPGFLTLVEVTVSPSHIMNILAQQSLSSLCPCVSCGHFFICDRAILGNLSRILHNVFFEASMPQVLRISSMLIVLLDVVRRIPLFSRLFNLLGRPLLFFLRRRTYYYDGPGLSLLKLESEVMVQVGSARMDNASLRYESLLFTDDDRHIIVATVTPAPESLLTLQLTYPNNEALPLTNQSLEVYTFYTIDIQVSDTGD
uniref:Cadherin domain-containing protein n=1 Tax=Heterorhabditis bacteriophora TaxID=37862 RepID=A0A1I7WGA1_HETBA